jgi:peptidyl-prolyl cis-trans isomerase SurA
MKVDNNRKAAERWCVLAVMVILVLPAHAERKVLERILARVNDDIITLSEYNNELIRMRSDLGRVYQGEELEKAFEKQKDNALENLIQNKLLVQKAKELGFGNKIDLEVSSYIEGFRKQNNIPDLRTLEQALAQAGMTMAAWREDIKNSILQEGLIGTFVQSKVVITDEEIKKYYDSHRKEFMRQAEVEIAEIVFYLEGNKEPEVKAKAATALEKLQKGEDFTTLATKVSEGPTAKQGGNIGNFKYGTMAPEIQKAVFALDAGQYTGLLKSKFGYQIIKVLKKKDAESIPLEEVKKNIQSKIYYDKYRPLLEKFLKEVRDESYVEIYKESVKTP